MKIDMVTEFFIGLKNGNGNRNDNGNVYGSGSYFFVSRSTNPVPIIPEDPIEIPNQNNRSNLTHNKPSLPNPTRLNPIVMATSND